MNDLRNPWHGISAWREMGYDIRHPIIWLKNVLTNTNKVPKETRQIMWAVVIVGLANVVVFAVLDILNTFVR